MTAHALAYRVGDDLSARSTAVQPVVKDARGKLVTSLAIAAAGSDAYSVYANDLAGNTQAPVAGAESSSSGRREPDPRAASPPIQVHRCRCRIWGLHSV